MALNAKQQRFVDEYLIDLNATQAAIRAGYKETTAEQQGCRLLRNAKVADAVAEAQEARSERTQIDADYVLQSAVAMYELDVKDILDDHGGLKPIPAWPKAWRQSISGMDVAEMLDGKGDEREVVGLLKKIKFPDKTKLLDMIGRHVTVKAWKDHIEHDVTDRASELIKARKRLESAG